MPDDHRPASDAHPPVDPACLGEALDWLILLEEADDACRQRFECWRTQSPEHARAFEAARRMWNAPLLGEAAARLEPTLARPRSDRRLRPLWGLAAAVLLAVGVGFHNELVLRVQADHLTATGQRQTVELADGSRVLLNTRTAFAADIDPTQRSARLLQGEAYFNVAPDPSRPFEVEAGPVSLSVRDTTFAVRYLGDEAEVSVERGELDLRSRRSDARMSLAAGDSVRIGPDGFSDRRRLAAEDLAWVRGRLVFQDCPLREVLAELRRYYPGWIINTDERLGERAVTGNYRLDDPIAVVRALADITAARLHEYPALVVID